MISKTIAQGQAKELRISGMSMNEISRYLGVSKSSVHNWTRDTILSPENQIKLLERGHQNLRNLAIGNKNKKTQRILEAHHMADHEWPQLKQKPEFLFGLALYLGEGTKVGNIVGITNVDPFLIRSGLKFYQVIGGSLPDVTCQIILHKGEDPDASLRYWSNETGLPVSQFNKVFLSKISGGNRATRLVQGTLSVRMNCAHLKRKVDRWMELARKEFGSL